MTQILPANSRQAIKLARRLLREGEVVAFPTDTLYGIGVNAFERFAVRRIFEVKERPAKKAIPVFIYQIDDLNLVARDVPNQAWPLLQKFWPGALTVVLPKVAALPDDVTAGQDTVAIRIPDHLVSLELVIQVGRPLAVTSANRWGFQPCQPTFHHHRLESQPAPNVTARCVEYCRPKRVLAGFGERRRCGKMKEYNRLHISSASMPAGRREPNAPAPKPIRWS
jgi:L-threonylcarbamoyladenylate synthase